MAGNSLYYLKTNIGHPYCLGGCEGKYGCVEPPNLFADQHSASNVLTMVYVYT